jgi:hypothetical protein
VQLKSHNHELQIIRKTQDHTELIPHTGKWPSYDRTWFSGPDTQEIFILTQRQVERECSRENIRTAETGDRACLIVGGKETIDPFSSYLSMKKSLIEEVKKNYGTNWLQIKREGQ